MYAALLARPAARLLWRTSAAKLYSRGTAPAATDVPDPAACASATVIVDPPKTFLLCRRCEDAAMWADACHFWLDAGHPRLAIRRLDSRMTGRKFDRRSFHDFQ